MKVGFRYGILSFVILAVSGVVVSGVEDVGSNSRAMNLLGTAQSLEKMDNKTGALEFYVRVVKRYPSSQEARLAITRIRVLGGKVPTTSKKPPVVATHSKEDSPKAVKRRRLAERNAPLPPTFLENLHAEMGYGPSGPNLVRVRFQGGTGVPRQGGVRNRLGLGFEMGPQWEGARFEQVVGAAFGMDSRLPNGKMVSSVMRRNSIHLYP